MKGSETNEQLVKIDVVLKKRLYRFLPGTLKGKKQLPHNIIKHSSLFCLYNSNQKYNAI